MRVLQLMPTSFFITRFGSNLGYFERKAHFAVLSKKCDCEKTCTFIAQSPGIDRAFVWKPFDSEFYKSIGG